MRIKKNLQNKFKKLKKTLAFANTLLYNISCVNLVRRSGGIGRRAGLKIRCWRQRVGSSPTFGTNQNNTWYFTKCYFLCRGM